MNRTDAATVVGRVREEEEKARNKIEAHEKVDFSFVCPGSQTLAMIKSSI